MIGVAISFAYCPRNRINFIFTENNGSVCSVPATRVALKIVSQYRQLLKINAANDSHCIVGDSVESDHIYDGYGWGDAFLGTDGCIHWPPYVAAYIRKYDPHSNETSLRVVGDD